MGDLIEKVTDFFKNEDLIDFVYTFFKERPELLIVVVAVVFIFVLSLWTMLERVQKRGVIALVPVYRFAALFKGVGLNPWLSILMIIPGVNFIMRIIFYVRVAKTFRRTYFMVPFLVVLPLLFLPIVAFGDGRCSHVRLPKVKKVKKSKVAKRMPETEAEPKTNIESESFDSGWLTADDILEEAMPKQAVAPSRSQKEFVPKKKGGFSIKINGDDEPVKRSGGFSIKVEGDDEPEEIHVLTMAELRQKRAQSKVMKNNNRHVVINDISAPKKAKHIETKKPQQPVKKAAVKVPKADRMPSMGQGPRSVDIARQRTKAEIVKGGEYERLLRKQQREQKNRESGTRRGVRQMDIVAKKKTVSKKKTSSRKIM